MARITIELGGSETAAVKKAQDRLKEMQLMYGWRVSK
jgi:hypothetical protein